MDRASSTSGANLLGRLLDTPRQRLGRQLRHPNGPAGRLLGHAMQLANRAPNRAAIAALEVASDDVALELGFGPGAGIAALAAKVSQGRVYGIDQSQDMLDLASRRNQAAIRAGRAFLLKGIFERLPLPGESVDKVLAVNVVYFWQNPEPVLSEVQRVLRPGGLLSLYATDAENMMRWGFADSRTHRLFDRQRLTGLLQDGGFAPDAICLRKISLFPMLTGWIATARKRL